MCFVESLPSNPAVRVLFPAGSGVLGSIPDMVKGFNRYPGTVCVCVCVCPRPLCSVLCSTVALTFADYRFREARPRVPV